MNVEVLATSQECPPVTCLTMPARHTKEITNRDEDVEVLTWQPVRISCDLPHPACPHPGVLAARLLEGTRGDLHLVSGPATTSIHCPRHYSG